jgi:hypothetical protein
VHDSDHAAVDAALSAAQSVRLHSFMIRVMSGSKYESVRSDIAVERRHDSGVLRGPRKIFEINGWSGVKR